MLFIVVVLLREVKVDTCFLQGLYPATLSEESNTLNFPSLAGPDFVGDSKCGSLYLEYLLKRC